MWDIRQALTLHAILPLGSEKVRLNAPLTKSILIAGPEGCGKKLLVHAICTEVGANLFDLSAANLTGKYPGKSGLTLLVHMVFKVTFKLNHNPVHYLTLKAKNAAFKNRHCHFDRLILPFLTSVLTFLHSAGRNFAAIIKNVTQI